MKQVATNENFAGIIASGEPVLVDFWASWCGPCRMISPYVDEIAEEYDGKATVVKCNVDDCEDIAAEFGIRNIPTLLFFKGGQVVDRLVGAFDQYRLFCADSERHYFRNIRRLHVFQHQGIRLVGQECGCLPGRNSPQGSHGGRIRLSARAGLSGQEY